ncbi:MAG: lipoyl(octanoyl) transferase LipB [Bacteroidetes bacterium]|jgi:lipoyl(octanoyl) transferase|nr:lipoyl(octanoyl) transferase LipB [Bacteroidota bacterium]
MQQCNLLDLGIMDYKQAWDLQLDLFQKKIHLKSAGTNPIHDLIFVEHPHVYTFGKSAERKNLLADSETLTQIGADVYDIERGGDITYHGPGQLVAYPIFDLEQLGIGVKAFVEGIETAIIRTLAEWNITAETIPGRIGVWIDKDKPTERKIAAIGIKCSRFVSMHGLALNVNTNLEMFGHIVPCGISDKMVCSMEGELGRQIDMFVVKNTLGRHFASIFGLQLNDEPQ